MSQVFLSYNFNDEVFVGFVYDELKRHETIEPIFFAHESAVGPHVEEIHGKIEKSSTFVLFCGKYTGATQKLEANYAVKRAFFVAYV